MCIEHVQTSYSQTVVCVLSCYILYRTLLVSVLALLPLLGGTWILGMLFLVDSDSVVVAWIFTIVNSMQVCNSNFKY